MPGDHGAHGSFDQRARGFSAQWWADSRRLLLGLTGVVGATAAIYPGLKNRRFNTVYDVLENWLPRAA